MSQEAQKANLILKHADIYGRDPIYKSMVDNTVFLTEEDKATSIYKSENPDAH